MGGLFSRSPKKRKGDISLIEPDDPVVPIRRLEGIHEEFTSELRRWEEQEKLINDEALTQFKDDFINRPDYFLSNLLMLSPQFYKNFEEERNEISKVVRDKEIEYNDKLAAYRRKINFVGAHEMISASHLLYHPPGNQHYELASYRQIYVIQDNVQLFPEQDFDNLQSCEYLEVDGGPTYRLCIENSKRHTGYVRLRCVDIIPGVSRHNTYEDIYRAITPVPVDDRDPFLDPRPLRRPSLVSEDSDEIPDVRKMGRRSSGVMPEGYLSDLHSDMSAVKERVSKIKKKTGPSSVLADNVGDKLKKQPKALKSNVGAPLININDKSFQRLQNKLAVMEEEDTEDEEIEDGKPSTINDTEENSRDSSDESSVITNSKPDLHSTIRKECFISRKMKAKSENDVYGLNKYANNDKRTYLSSERYHQTFEDDFEELLKAIDKEHLIGNTEVEIPSIVTKDLYRETLLVNTEYVPALVCSEWPDCAVEWRFRDRKVKADPITKMVYRWPKSRHIEEISQQHGCTIVPMGYYNPRNPNGIKLIEWQLQFVRAEQILLRSLGHQQIRVLLMIQLLFRDHVDQNASRVLRPQHFRYVLFWLCEHNYRDWQYDRLACRVKAYLKTLYNALSQGELPHYFIRRVNLLENIKEKSLRIVQEAVKRLTENLPMHLMHTMHRLRTQEDYYPSLGIKGLYNIVKVKKYGISDLNPLLAGAIPDQEEESDMDSDSSSNTETEEDRMLKMRIHAERNRRKSLFLEKTGQPKTERVKKVHNVNVKIRVTRLNDLRAEKLLTMFSKHFLDIAAFSNRFRAHPQAYRYLDYAEDMLDILTDHEMNCPPVSGTEVDDLKSEIRREMAVTKQGLNYMLNNTHRMTGQLEIKVAHIPVTKPANWEFKKREAQLEEEPILTPTEPCNFDEPSLLPSTSATITENLQESSMRRPISSTKRPESSVKRGVKKFPLKKDLETNVSKSLSDFSDSSMLRSMITNTADDGEFLTFKVASDDEDDDQSTDL